MPCSCLPACEAKSLARLPDMFGNPGIPNTVRGFYSSHTPSLTRLELIMSMHVKFQECRRSLSLDFHRAHTRGWEWNQVQPVLCAVALDSEQTMLRSSQID